MKSQSNSQDWPKPEDLKTTQPTSKNPSPSKGLAKATSQELDDILVEFARKHERGFYGGGTPKDALRIKAESRAKLLELALSCLPKKKYPIGVIVGTQNNKASFNQGHNAAIDTMEQRIKSKFGGSDV